MRKRGRWAVFARDNYQCQYCGRDLLADVEVFSAAVLDHVTPRSAGGPDGPDNRVASCGTCDRIKADIQATSLAEAQALLQERREIKQRIYQHVLRLAGRAE